MLGWCASILAALLGYYFAYVWKLNWIKDLREKSAPSGKVKWQKRRQVGKLPPVYPNGWFALLESSQIKKGEAKHVSAIGENFAVFRTEEGDVYIVDAYCPHLGANMAEGGRVVGNCIQCPFHKWQFRGTDGRCDRIPYSSKVPSIAKVKSWKCCEVNHLIFVWYHAEGEEPCWRPMPFHQVSSGCWRYQGRNEFLVNCHIQDVAENGADLAHLSAVHGQAVFLGKLVSSFARHSWTNAKWSPKCSNRSESDTESDEVESDANPRLNGTCSNGGSYGINDQRNGRNERNTINDEKHIATMQLSHSFILFNRFPLLGLTVKVEQIGPGYVELILESIFGSVCILQTVTPLEPLLQRVTHLIFCPPLLAPYASMILLGECLMFERDVAIWNHKRFEKSPILVKEEQVILAYRRWYSQFYSKNSATYWEARDSLNW